MSYGVGISFGYMKIDIAECVSFSLYLMQRCEDNTILSNICKTFSNPPVRITNLFKRTAMICA